MPTANRPAFTLLLVALLLFLTAPACRLSLTLDASPAGRPTPTAAAALRAAFIGQDGASHAGRLCSSGTQGDNVHLHLAGIPPGSAPVAFRVDDSAAGGVWASPCDPVSNWFLYVTPVQNGEADLYFKPFRDAPAGTRYRVTVTYDDGAVQVAEVEGRRVKP